MWQTRPFMVQLCPLLRLSSLTHIPAHLGPALLLPYLKSLNHVMPPCLAHTAPLLQMHLPHLAKHTHLTRLCLSGLASWKSSPVFLVGWTVTYLEPSVTAEPGPGLNSIVLCLQPLIFIAVIQLDCSFSEGQKRSYPSRSPAPVKPWHTVDPSVLLDE